MLGYAAFGTALAAAVAMLAIGIAKNRLPPITEAAVAGECCVYPGRDQRCVPCRPTDPAYR
jgi:hypothetical protein